LSDTTTTVVTTDDGGDDETADAIEELAEAVEELAEAVEGNDEVDDAVELALRLERIENRLSDMEMRGTGVDYDTARQIATEVATGLVVPVAAEVAEVVADEVADEVADSDGTPQDDGDDTDVTIVTPDVSEVEERRSWWHKVW
jgi:hypothetical protein